MLYIQILEYFFLFFLSIFNYPRYPKGQAYVERMNRALQEEFVMYHEDYKLEDIHEFNKKILQYMLL
jgi:hypothetical protein